MGSEHDERIRPRERASIEIEQQQQLGRVPLFYFVLHFIAAHIAAFALAVLTYGSSAFTFMWQPVPSMGGAAKSFPPDFGWNLWVAYAVWITIVVALYPLCRWFAFVEERRRDWWLSYF